MSHRSSRCFVSPIVNIHLHPFFIFFFRAGRTLSATTWAWTNALWRCRGTTKNLERAVTGPSTPIPTTCSTTVPIWGDVDVSRKRMRCGKRRRRWRGNSSRLKLRSPSVKIKCSTSPSPSWNASPRGSLSRNWAIVWGNTRKTQNPLLCTRNIWWMSQHHYRCVFGHSTFKVTTAVDADGP